MESNLRFVELWKGDGQLGMRRPQLPAGAANRELTAVNRFDPNAWDPTIILCMGSSGSHISTVGVVCPAELRTFQNLTVSYPFY